MDKEKKLAVQALLRKIDPKTRKHMMSRENLSHMPSERDALRHARLQGKVDFLFKEKVLSTRFQTETEENYVKKMEEKAKKHLEKDQGGNMGMEEPIMEIKKNELTTMILEEMDSVLEEGRRERLAKKNGCKAMKGKVFRMRRADWRRFKKAYRLKEKQWPHSAFPAFSVKDPEGKPDGEASFNNFYDEIRKNKCAYIALGGYRKKMPANGTYPFDYKFGNQHADAYAYLNPATRAGGKVKVGDETVDQLASVGSEVETDLSTSHRGARKNRFFTDPMAYQLATYEKYSRRGEQYKRKVAKYLEELQAIEGLLNGIEAERRQISASNMSNAEKRAKFRPLTAKFENYYKQGEQIKKILNMLRQGKMASKAGKLAQAAAAKAKKLGSQKNYSQTAMRRAQLFLARKYEMIKKMKAHELGAEIREMEEFLDKGQLPPDVAKQVKAGLEIYRDRYQDYGRGPGGVRAS